MNEIAGFWYATPVASVIFVITLAASWWAFSSDNAYANMILHPYGVYRGYKRYTVISSGLIHADMMHLLFNMLSYFFFAFQLEKDMGHWQFGLLYFLSLILSDLPTVYKHKNDDWYYCLGASGAVSAVIFGAILYDPIAPLGFMLIPGVQIPAVIYGILYLIYCNYASKRASDNINHDAHMFGALSGLLLTIVLNPHVVHEFIEKVIAGVQSWLH